jgi:hypothetical protein
VLNQLDTVATDLACFDGVATGRSAVELERVVAAEEHRPKGTIAGSITRRTSAGGNKEAVHRVRARAARSSCRTRAPLAARALWKAHPDRGRVQGSTGRRREGFEHGKLWKDALSETFVI